MARKNKLLCSIIIDYLICGEVDNKKVVVYRLFVNLRTDKMILVVGAFKISDRELTYKFSQYPIYRDSSPHYIIRKEDIPEFNNID